MRGRAARVRVGGAGSRRAGVWVRVVGRRRGVRGVVRCHLGRGRGRSWAGARQLRDRAFVGRLARRPRSVLQLRRCEVASRVPGRRGHRQSLCVRWELQSRPGSVGPTRDGRASFSVSKPSGDTAVPARPQVTARRAGPTADTVSWEGAGAVLGPPGRPRDSLGGLLSGHTRRARCCVPGGRGRRRKAWRASPRDRGTAVSCPLTRRASGA